MHRTLERLPGVPTFAHLGPKQDMVFTVPLPCSELVPASWPFISFSPSEPDVRLGNKETQI